MDENTILHKLLDIFEFKRNYQQQSSGIPPQDMYILERISFHETILIRDVTRSCGIPPSTLTSILDRLEVKGLIRRIRSREDRRAVSLAVTDAGAAVLCRHTQEDQIFVRNLFKALPADKRQAFLKSLEELLEKIDTGRLFKNEI